MTTGPRDHGALMHRLIDAWNDRDVDGFVDCYTDPLLLRTGDGEEDLEISRLQHAEAAHTWWQRFPDLEEEIEEILVDGDRVLLRTRSTGTLQIEWRGIRPNGEQVAWDAWYVYRVHDGLVTEERMLMDLMGLFVQLGAVEPPGT